MRIERCGSVARERHSPRLRQETASCRVGVSVRAQRGGTPVHQTRRREILLELTSLGVLGSTVASTVGPIVASMVALPTPAAQADEAASVVATGGRVGFLEISVDRKPFGRIEIEVFSDPNVKIGVQRFLDLCEEIQGVGYKRGKINRLLDSHIQGGALTNLSYRADGRTAITGGLTAELLEEELDRSTRRHDVAGLVSLNVRPKRDMETKDMLKAIDGKLVNVTQTFGMPPNGTEFSITTGPAPDLDGINLIVGRVTSGMDVVEALQKLPKVKNNKSSAFFKAGKMAKDRRADVAELGFDRPFSVVTIDSGVYSGLRV